MRHLAAIFLLTTAAQPAADNQFDWRWDAEGPNCSLRQVIAGDGSTIGIARTPGTDQTIIRIGPYDWPPPSEIKKFEILKPGQIAFSPGRAMPTDVRMATFKDGGRDIAALSSGSDFMALFAKAAEIKISHGKLGSVSAPVRAAAAAVQALQKCEDQKMSQWGIDPIAWRTLATKPDPIQPPYEWLTGNDYPRLAAAYGLQGWVIARLEVAPNGRVKDCKAVNLDKYSGFRDALCDAMKRRGRFRPAVDSSGTPVSAPYVVTVRFALE